MLLLRKISPKPLSWALVLLGILFRLVQYLSNRNMTIDEFNYAFLLSEMSLKEILHGKFIYPAPYGFIIIQKLAVYFWGSDEYVLRFFPFLSSILALWLFNKVKNQFSKSWGGIVALALFTACSVVIYYSSEVRVYSFDVLVALYLLWLGLKMRSSPLNSKSIILFGLSGAVAIWFSFPSIIILSAVFMAGTWEYVHNKDWKNLRIRMMIGVAWGLNFMFFYFWGIQKFTNFSKTHIYWFEYNKNIIHKPASLFFHLEGIWSHFYKMFINPAGLNLPLLAIFFFFLGCYAIYSKNKFKCLLLSSPILLAAVAAILKKYPFKERLILFLLPSLFLLIGLGWEYFYNQERKFFKNGFYSFILLILLLFHPFQNSYIHLFNPIKRPKIKQAMQYIKSHLQKNDCLYVVQWTVATPVEYYKDQIKIPSSIIFKASGGIGRKAIIKDMKKLSKFRRVWIIYGPARGLYQRQILDFFNHKAKQLDVFRTEGTFCYLYEFQ